jgi:flagellar basal body P-ring formation protein FlgA
MNIRRILIMLTVLPLLAQLCAVADERVAVRLNFSDSAMVNDTTIRLSDIASIEAPAELKTALSGLAIGEAAPAGYSRFINTDDLFQYCLGPQFPRVTFSHVSGKRVSVRTDALEYSLANFEKQIDAFLQEKVKGVTGTFAFEILNADRSWKSLNRPIDVAIEGEMKNAGIGNFNVNLKMTHGAKTTTIPVLVRSSLTSPVAIAKVPIARGDKLSAENCEIMVKRITSAAFMPYSSIAALANMRAYRTISPGTPISSQYVEKIPAVVKGDQVCISMHQGDVAISLFGIARESGGIGDRVWVENTMSHKLVQARINGIGKAEIKPQGASL